MAGKLRNTFTPKPVSENATNLEHLLAQIPQGRAICISYVRMLALDDKRFDKLIRDYDSNKKQDLGNLCTTHSIEHAEFLSLIMKMAYPVMDEALKLSHMISTGIVAARLPKVVERGYIEAGKRDGVADRHFVLQKEGFHVAPKGMNISLNQINANAAGLPSFEDSIKELDDILSVDGELLEDHLLEAGDENYIEETEAELEEKILV